jgi:hypothetical protein
VQVMDVPDESGGSVQVLDHDEQELVIDPNTGALILTSKCQVKTPTPRPGKSTNKTKSGDATHVLIEQSNELNALWDKAESDAVKNETHVTGVDDRFVRVCKAVMKLPHHQHALYRKWLLENV